MLYLCQSLTDAEGQCGAMVSLLPGKATMQKRLTALALQLAKMPEGDLRGHTFHHSRMEMDMTPTAHGACPNNGPTTEAVYCRHRLAASYIHWYFPSNPDACARLFQP
jgi:cobyrinic acid a,c-diamide synthase